MAKKDPPEMNYSVEVRIHEENPIHKMLVKLLAERRKVKEGWKKKEP